MAEVTHDVTPGTKPPHRRGPSHHGNQRTVDPYRWGNTMELHGEDMMLAGNTLSDAGI